MNFLLIMYSIAFFSLTTPQYVVGNELCGKFNMFGICTVGNYTQK